MLDKKIFLPTFRRFTKGYRKDIFNIKTFFTSNEDSYLFMNDISLNIHIPKFRLITCSWNNFEIINDPGFWFDFGSFYLYMKGISNDEWNEIKDIEDINVRKVIDPFVKLHHLSFRKPSFLNNQNLNSLDLYDYQEWINFTDRNFIKDQSLGEIYSIWKIGLLCQWKICDNYIDITSYDPKLHFLIKYKIELFSELDFSGVFYLPKKLPKILKKDLIYLYKENNWIFLTGENWFYKFPYIEKGSLFFEPKGIKSLPVKSFSFKRREMISILNSFIE